MGLVTRVEDWELGLGTGVLGLEIEYLGPKFEIKNRGLRIEICNGDWEAGLGFWHLG